MVQIENYHEGEGNPYTHSAQDTVARLNLDYWMEQVKATTAIAAELAVPVAGRRPGPYLPLRIKAY